MINQTEEFQAVKWSEYLLWCGANNTSPDMSDFLIWLNEYDDSPSIFQKKQSKIVSMFELEKQMAKEILEDARKPLWVKQAEYGDAMADGSDDQPWEENDGFERNNEED